jgi:hypothetical protein
MFKRIVFFLSLLAALVRSAGAQTDTWLEVHTPRFVIVTNSGEKEGRRVARQFEGMRSVFQRVFPDAELDQAAPILVFAVRDKRTLQELEPTVYLSKGQLNMVRRAASSGPRGTSKGMCLSARVRLARTMRWAMVGSGVRKARAILVGGEAAEKTEGEGCAGLRGEDGMAGDEDEAEEVVADGVV